MRTGLGVALGAVVLALAAASMSCAQSPAVISPRAQVMLSSGGLIRASAEISAQGEMVREILDPHTGDRWLLMRNDAVPGGPGRLLLVAAHRNAAGGTLARTATQTEETGIHPVIRAGDRLIVEEHTAVADAALEARALTPAALGSALNVRLAIGGRVVRAVALGPGRAVFQPETGVRP
jgi:hypothetical protein